MIIEVYSDVVCPWCYVGERRLTAALETLPEVPVEVRWQPFQLRPEMAEQGEPWAKVMHEKFGGEAQAHSIFAHVAEVGAQEGINFAFDRVASAPNSRDAHRLILWAAEQGQAWQMADALFAAYFTHGRNLNDQDQLVAIAREAGFDEEATRAFLESGELAAEVTAGQQRAYELGIHSVPSYVINGRYLIQGAQPSDLFARALAQIAGEPLPTP